MRRIIPLVFQHILSTAPNRWGVFDLDATEFGEDQRTGYLAAYPEGDEKPSWLLKVYSTTNVQNLEQDVQDVYFKSMKLDEDNRTIVIENETGNTFTVDIDNREVK